MHLIRWPENEELEANLEHLAGSLSIAAALARLQLVDYRKYVENILEIWL